MWKRHERLWFSTKRLGGPKGFRGRDLTGGGGEARRIGLGRGNRLMGRLTLWNGDGRMGNST